MNRDKIMTAMVEAVWNDEKEIWEVHIIQEDRGIVRVDDINIYDCDEWVIPRAVALANGIEVK